VGVPAATNATGDRLPTIAGALRAAARRVGTPCYVTDVAALAAAADVLAAAFPDPWLRAYSLKANDSPAIVARLAARGLAANVVSRGEWALAARAGVVNAAITLEGIGKTDAELRAVARAAAAGEPLRWVALESAEEAAALARAVERERGRGPAGLGNRAGSGSPAGPRAPSAAHRVDVLLRVNPGVEPETYPGLATGAAASKFGLTPDEVAAAIAAGGGPDGPLRWRGLHLHVGSQLGAVDAWRDAVRRLLALFALLRGGLPDFDTVDLGGGFPVGPPGVPVPGPARFAAEVPALLAAIPPDRRPARLAVEPGRVLVAHAGWLVARVLHVRERTGPAPELPVTDSAGPLGLAIVPPGARAVDSSSRIVVIDAGMTELIRPALYGAEHEVLALTSLGRPVPYGEPAGAGRASASWRAAAATRHEDEEVRGLRRARGGKPVILGRLGGELRPARVDGPVCESTDTFGEHLLPPLRRGDLVAIRDAGAYAASMSSRYNGRPRPAEVLVEPDGSLTVARRRSSPLSLD
jgi:diaminopimelate decarboxylase